MLGERHFFKPRTHVELGDVLSGHPVIEDKHHRYQTLDDRRIAIAAQVITPVGSWSITIQTWL